APHLSHRWRLELQLDRIRHLTIRHVKCPLVGSRQLAAIVAFTVAVSMGLAVSPGDAAEAATTASSLSTLPITYPLWSGGTLTYWNAWARSSDVAMITPSGMNLLGSVSKGMINVVFDSWASAQSQIPNLKTHLAIVTYDAEHWSATPTSEQNNLVATTQQFAS